MKKLRVQNKTQKITQYFRKSILANKHRNGEKLPSAVCLGTKFGVTKETVNMAMSYLVSEGLVCREQGKGTFVTHPQVLKGEKYKNIGLYLIGLTTQLIPNEAPAHYAIVHRIANIVGDRGYNTTILGRKDTNLSLKKLKEARIDGLIVIGGYISACSGFMPVLKTSNIPYILMDRYDLKEDINYVEEYSADEIYKATQYLIKLGHKKIAGIGYKSNHLVYRNFYSGFGKALKERNLYDPSLIGEIKYNTEEELSKIIKVLYSHKNPPTAIFLFYGKAIDNFFLGLKKHKLNIPKDVSIMVVNNERVIKDSLKITTVGAIPKVEFGETAANKLIDLIEAKIHPPVNIKLKLKLLKGQSCKNLKIKGMHEHVK